jgi:hypothetical protein
LRLGLDDVGLDWVPDNEENDMRIRVKAFWTATIFVLAAAGSAPKAGASPLDERGSMVIIFKDGHSQSVDVADVARIDLHASAMIVFKDEHRKSIPGADVSRIEFENPASASAPGKNHFVGKWKVGDGNRSTFYITLERDGGAKKSLGPPHGSWTVVEGEARITWDDGWHDAIRKVGARHEKRAYEPGRSFDDPPSNVTTATNTEPKEI